MPTIVYEQHRATFEVPRHAEFERHLATDIPPAHWSYYTVRQVYLVWEPYVDAAVEIAMTYFPRMDEIGVRRPRQEDPNRRKRSQEASGGARTNDRGNPDRRRLFVTDNAPDAVVDAAYRALSRLYHPDMGGSTEQMQELNAAYDRLKEKERVTRR